MANSTVAKSASVEMVVAEDYAKHTFLIRTAPAQSTFSGQVCAEIQCPGDHFAKQPLRELGIEYKQLETWVNPKNGRKLLRFTASVESYLKLHDACSNPSHESVDMEAQGHLATLSVALAAEALSSSSVKELRNLAKKHGIVGVAKMKKGDLLAVLMAHRSVVIAA